MQRRLRQACTAVKEHGAANCAKMAAASGFFCSVDVIVTRATSPSDVPFHDSHVHELLKVFSISGHASLRRFSLSFTRRLGRTRSWRVALKCLLLLHRLLRSSSETAAYLRSELLWSIANGLISLHPCRFRDDSSANSDHYTAFVRCYAHFLDEALNSTVFHEAEDTKAENAGFSDKMKEVGRVLELLPQLQSLMDRAMKCRPAGPAVRSFVVKAAVKSIVRDSFGFYDAFRREIAAVLDVLFQMPYGNCVKAFGVYKKASSQAVELSEFYDWCKEIGVCGFYEYPFVERIPVLQIQALERFLDGMWRFTDSEEEEEEEEESSVGSQSSGTEDEGRERFEKKLVVKSEYCDEEEEPLIQFGEECDENESWEALLEASVNMSPMKNSLSFSNSSLNNGFGCNNPNGININPFNQPWNMQDYSHGYSGFRLAFSREGYNNNNACRSPRTK